MNAKESFEYLIQPGTMEGSYLGACLDGCRLGSSTTVAWETTIRGLMGLIQKWREENDDNEKMYHEEPIDRIYKRFELPHVKNDSCPRDKKHEGTFIDSGGVVRCGHRTIRRMRPSFVVEYDGGIDEHSQMRIKRIYEEEPRDPSYVNDDGDVCYPEGHWEKYLVDKER